MIDDRRAHRSSQLPRAERILVTGGTGHLGANLIRRLVADGHAVRATMRPHSNTSALEGVAVERVLGDLRQPGQLREAVRGCSYIFHCAALVSTQRRGIAAQREAFATNVMGTRNLFIAAEEANVRRVVMTGYFGADCDDVEGATQISHDIGSHDIRNVNPFAGATVHQVTKQWAERECLRAYARGLDVVIAASSILLGPHDPKPSRIGKLLCDFASGGLPTYLPGSYEFVSAADSVRGHVLAMEHGRAGAKYLFSTRSLTLDELIGYFEEVTGRKRPWARVPARLASGIAGAFDSRLRNLSPAASRCLRRVAALLVYSAPTADCSKAKSELGYEATSIIEAVHEAYEDFARRGKIPGVDRPARIVIAPSAHPANNAAQSAPSVEVCVEQDSDSAIEQPIALSDLARPQKAVASL